MFDVNHLLALIEKQKSKQFLVAFSGGLDSAVLLHAMVQLSHQNPAFTVRAVHVNHGLSPNADEWQQHGQRCCDAYDIPLLTYRASIEKKSGLSLEAQARVARYEFFDRHLAVDECLLTAHTKNDQAETLLLQLMRGAGPKGLSAMPTIKSFSHGYLMRPLLSFTREDLQVYADEHQLQWIEDESNLDLRFDRNFFAT